MPAKIDFWWDLGGFWEGKSMLTSSGRFSQKLIKTIGFSMIFVDLGRQVGIENRLKIHIKMKSTSEGILASIFLNFGGFWEATWRRNSSQNRCKNASKKRWKIRCVLEASWGGGHGRNDRADPGPPPNYHVLKNHPTHKRTCTTSPEPSLTPSRLTARWRIRHKQ